MNLSGVKKKQSNSSSNYRKNSKSVKENEREGKTAAVKENGSVSVSQAFVWRERLRKSKNMWEKKQAVKSVKLVKRKENK